MAIQDARFRALFCCDGEGERGVYRPPAEPIPVRWASLSDKVLSDPGQRVAWAVAMLQAGYRPEEVEVA